MAEAGSTMGRAVHASSIPQRWARQTLRPRAQVHTRRYRVRRDCCLRKLGSEDLTSAISDQPIRPEQLVDLRNHSLQLAAEDGVALLRVATDALVRLVRHAS